MAKKTPKTTSKPRVNMRGVMVPHEWAMYLIQRREQTGIMLWRQLVAALEMAYGSEPGAPRPLGEKDGAS